LQLTLFIAHLILVNDEEIAYCVLESTGNQCKLMPGIPDVQDIPLLISLCLIKLRQPKSATQQKFHTYSLAWFKIYPTKNRSYVSGFVKFYKKE